MHAARLSNAARPTRRSKRQAMLGLIVGGCLTLGSTGCASRSMSLASMNPFASKSTASVSEPNKGPSFIASTGQTVGRAAGGVGLATKNAFNKTTGTVAGWFGGEDSDSEIDPLSLDSGPTKMEPDVLVANGQLWESTGNLTKAMESYSKALEQTPNHGPALTSVARLHFREGNHAKAAEFFQKAIAQNPTDAALFNDLGLTLGKLGQHDMAAQTLSRALQLAPGTSRYANNLASVQFESGRVNEAFGVLSANNKPAVAHFNMAFLHYKKGQSADAQNHLQQAISLEDSASGDPATKRAVDRSREMLAQLNPGLGTAPAANIAAKPSTAPAGAGSYGAAAGPEATVAAMPSHKANQTPPSYGTIPNYLTKGNTGGAQPVVPGSNSAVSYQDGTSTMAPPNVATTPSIPAADKPANTPTPGATAPTPFSLPKGFTLPE